MNASGTATAPSPSTRPPKLQKLYESAKRLAILKAKRDSWVKTAKALDMAEVKKPAAS